MQKSIKNQSKINPKSIPNDALGRSAGGSLGVLGLRPPASFRVTFAGPQNRAKRYEGCSKWRVGEVTREDAEGCRRTRETDPQAPYSISKRPKTITALGHASRARGTVADGFWVPKTYQNGPETVIFRFWGPRCGSSKRLIQRPVRSDQKKHRFWVPKTVQNGPESVIFCFWGPWCESSKDFWPIFDPKWIQI